VTRTVSERKSLLPSSKARARRRTRGRLERSLGGGPEHKRLAGAAGEQLVPREQGREGADDGHARWTARV
jgi:hypothetical protein